MENNKNIEQEIPQEEKLIDQDNFEDDNNENGKVGEEQIGINFDGEYDGEMEEDEEASKQLDQENKEIDQEREAEGEEQDHQENIEHKQEDKEVDGQKEMEAGHKGNNEEAKEEAIQEVHEEQNEEVNNENNYDLIKEEKEKQTFDLIDNDKNINFNKKISNKKRIELLSNRLNLNRNKAQNSKIENITNKEIEIDKEESNKNDDILSELLDEIQDFKVKKQDFNIKLNQYSKSSSNLDMLDKELSKGLEKLNNINYKINNNYKTNEEQKSNYQPNNINKILKNPKFKEIISIMNEKDLKVNKKNNIDKKGLFSLRKMNQYNFSNINLFIPKRNSNLLNTLEKKNNVNFRTFGNESNKYYISCIDGKAIVNGMRKEIPFTSKLGFNDSKLNKNNYLFDDLNNKTNKNYTIKNYGKTARRINSLNINSYFKKNENSKNNCERNEMKIPKIKVSKGNLANKSNKINNNYFKMELKFLK
jgi:hypothetical protein